MIRLEQQQQALMRKQEELIFTTGSSTIYTRAGRQGKQQPCNMCNERLPTFIADCSHRMCGECVPKLIKSCSNEMVNCPVCPQEVSLIPVQLLGDFVDLLLTEQES